MLGMRRGSKGKLNDFRETDYGQCSLLNDAELPAFIGRGEGRCETVFFSLKRVIQQSVIDVHLPQSLSRRVT